MLEELGKDLLNVAMAGVGAVAILTEKAIDLGKICAEKGAETLEKGKALNEELKRKGEQVAQEHRDRCANEALERLTAEERAELRRKLTELDEKEAAAQAEAERIAAEQAQADKVIHIDVQDADTDGE